MSTAIGYDAAIVVELWQRARIISDRANSSPNNGHSANDGVASNANPVVASPTAARRSAAFTFDGSAMLPSRGHIGPSCYGFDTNRSGSSSKVSLSILPVN